jgi:hypothetical protein
VIQPPSNLFNADWTLGKTEEVVARHPRRPLLPPLGSDEWHRAALNPSVRHLLKPLRAKAEEEWAEPLPDLTDELYESFHRTGIRLTFETVYFERRRRLARAAVSLLLSVVNEESDPWRERLQASMLSKFNSIFDEVSWSLPAHVNPSNASGKDPLQIDLFCAETANLMAEMLDLFGSIIAPDLQRRVHERLRTTVFENYLNSPFGWKDITNNWNAVCHQGVLGAALSALDDKALLSRMLFMARQHLPAFLSGYGADGGSSEGPGYWSYGFGWFSVLNEQLETRTDGELSLFEGDPHIREIARFGPRVSLRGGNLVNFADGGATGGLRPPMLAYLAKRLDDPDCAASAVENYRQLVATGIGMSDERCDLFYLVRTLLFCPDDLSTPATAGARDCFLPDLAVLVVHGTDSRGHQWDFAAKAGHNDEHHNHNDCGSFILNIDGVRLITEIGAPEYVHAFFSEKRYEFLAARTLGHSLPIINSCEQAAGRSHASRVLSCIYDSAQATFALEAAPCYPPEAACKSFVRTFHFDKHAGRLTIDDSFDLTRAGALESAIVTFQPLSIDGDHAVIKAEDLTLILRPAPGTRLDRVETHTYSDHRGKEAHIHRLVLTPDLLLPQLSLKVEITLAP